jgi:hypothetical protein
MSLLKTIQATNNVNNGMTGPSNNGHAASTVAWSDPPTGSQTKTIQWDTFPSIPGIVKQVRVKFDWTRNASISGNGSTNWTVSCSNGDVIIQELGVTGSASGSVDFILTAGFSQPQTLNIFEFIQAAVFVGGFGGGASLTTQISNLRFEVTYDDTPPPVWIG